MRSLEVFKDNFGWILKWWILMFYESVNPGMDWSTGRRNSQSQSLLAESSQWLPFILVFHSIEKWPTSTQGQKISIVNYSEPNIHMSVNSVSNLDERKVLLILGEMRQKEDKTIFLKSNFIQAKGTSFLLTLRWENVIIYFKNLIWLSKSLLAKPVFTSQEVLEMLLVNEFNSDNLWPANLSMEITESFNMIFELHSAIKLVTWHIHMD